MQDHKPTRLHLGRIGDPTLDDEETLLAMLAASQNIWLSAPDLTEMNDLRRDMKHCDYSELARMCERAFDVLRRYLPDYTAFINKIDDQGGLSVEVAPDERALHQAEHEDRILERGTEIIPYTPSKRVKFYLTQFTDGRGDTHRVLYRRIRIGKSAKDWQLVWAQVIGKEDA